MRAVSGDSIPIAGKANGSIRATQLIVFGLGFATVLTLVVTPAALMAIANLAAWRWRRISRRAERRAPRLAAAQPAE